MNQETKKDLAFYITTPHACSYLDDKEAVTLFADPEVDINTQQYSKLITYGFRRSGTHIYRPRCPQCDACIPLRIPVNEFKPSRNQRRVLKANTDIQLIARQAEFSQEHFDLYQLYISTRHAGGGMDDPAP
ncbi:MAG: arginyltransferase, partial [Gammaproteobacteria bacterium]|nr:arginyltransferase [Gammaproteobacteria bacterium]